MRIKIVSILLVCCCLAVSAQSESVEKSTLIEYKNAVGFQAGQISGLGLSWHRWIDKIGLQVTGGIIYSPDESFFADKLNYNLGVEIQYMLFANTFGSSRLSNSTTVLYVYSGLNHFGYIKGEGWDSSDDTFYPCLATGLGIGLEFILARHLSIPIGFGYVATWSPASGDSFEETFSIDMSPQLGIRYRF